MSDNEAALKLIILNNGVFTAIKNGYLTELEEHIKRLKLNKKELNQWKLVIREPSKDTVLHSVVRTKHKDILRWLLDQGADACVEQRNADSKLPLHEAAQNCSSWAVEKLLEMGASVDPLSRGVWTPLMLAATKTSPNAVGVARILLSHEADIGITNKDGWTAVHICCRTGNSALLKFFLEQPYHPATTKQTNNGRTLLHIVALHGHTSLLPLLKQHCAQYCGVNAVDSCGTTPVMDALRNGFIDTAKEIGSLWPNVDWLVSDRLGRNIVHVAAEAGQLASVQLAVGGQGVDAKQGDKDGVTPLHLAAREGHLDVMKLLMDTYKCSATDCDKSGRDALWFANTNNRADCAALLRSAGCDSAHN